MSTKIWTGLGTDPTDWDADDNWSPSGEPTDGDDVILENADSAISTNLDQSAVALASLTIYQSFTGTIGSSTVYLQIGSSVVNIGVSSAYGSASGSGRLNIDLGSTTDATVNIYDSATSGTDSGFPPIRIQSNNSDNVINITKGDVGICAATGETSTVGSIRISEGTSNSDVDLFCGSGLTLATLDKLAGTATVRCAVTTVHNHDGTLTVQTSGNFTTINQYGGDLDIVQSGTIGTLNTEGGNTYPKNTGTITTCKCQGGNTDFTKCPTARTVTSLQVWADNATLKLDPGNITITNGITPQEILSLTTTTV